MEYSPEMQSSILKKLAFNSDKRPHIRTCKSKLAYAFTVLNSISRNITANRAEFALQIIKAIQIYKQDIKIIELDKLILKICNKYYIDELFRMVDNYDDADIAICAAIIWYKNKGKINEKWMKKIRKASKEIQEKAKEIIKRENGEKKREKNKLEECVSECWNDLNRYKGKVWGFSEGIENIEKNKIKRAKYLLYHQLKQSIKEEEAHIYNLLGLTHMLLLEYHESRYYLEKGIENGECVGHFQNCLFYLERRAGIPAPYSPIKIEMAKEYRLTDIFENKFMFNLAVGNLPYRSILNFRYYITESVFNELVKELNEKYSETGLFIFYVWENKLYLYNLKRIIELKVDWDEVEREFDEIMTENKAVLGMKIEGNEEKRVWWNKRMELDRRLGKIINKMKKVLPEIKSKRVILLLDERTIKLPFESFFDQPACRVHSLEIFTNMKRKTELKSGFYLLDAANNLERTRERICEFLMRAEPPCSLEGVVGRELTNQEQAELAERELFMYFGHGSGRKYVSIDGLLPRLLFLFGCSSGRLITLPNYMPNGSILRHLKANRLVLGMLWDVTDKDIDQFTVSFLSKFFSGAEPSVAIHQSRATCRLRYLNGAAPVIYGLSGEYL